MTYLPLEEDYRIKVLTEITQLRRYFSRQMCWHRILDEVCIVGGAVAVVLVAIPAIPRWALALAPAVVTAAVALQSRRKFKDSAVQAMKLANALERELNLYVMAAGPYVVERPRSHGMFAGRVEAIRAGADQAFAEVWARPPETVPVQCMPTPLT